jgi:calcium-dependent protein kinase
MVQEMQRNKKERTLHNEIFDHLIMILKQKGITLLQVFEEIDNDRSGYIEVEEFHDMLERMGFTIKYEQVLSLIKTMDENFDGRITYKELYNHLERLGFDMKELMGSKDDEVQYML